MPLCQSEHGTILQSVINIQQYVGCLIGTQQSNSKWTRGERHHIVVVVVVVAVVIVTVIIVIAIAVTAVVFATTAAAVHCCRCHRHRRCPCWKADGRQRRDKR
jgi:hypothetical protein